MAKIEFKLGKVYPPYAYDAEEGQGTNDFQVYSIDKCVDGVTTHWGAIEVMTTGDDAARVVAAMNAAYRNNDGEKTESSLTAALTETLARRFGDAMAKLVEGDIFRGWQGRSDGQR